MEKLKQLMDNKLFKIILNIIKVIFVIIIIAFIAVVYLQRFSDNKISFFKYRMFTVVSGSMEPKYKVGDVLFSKETPSSKIKVGYDISYLGKTGDVKDKIVTHRVIRIEKKDDGQYVFYAQGLSNLFEDPVIYENQLYGVVVSKSVVLSFANKIIATNIGLYLCIIVPLIIVISYEIVATAVEREDKKRAKLGM